MVLWAHHYLNPIVLTDDNLRPSSRRWMMNLHEPQVQVRVATVTCSSVAVLFTLTRSFIRRKRLWLDDAAAIFSLLTLVVQIVAVFINPKPGTNMGEVRYYVVAVTFFAILWSSRLSILFSLIRINPFPECRKKLKYLAVIFIIVPLLLILQCFLTCAPKSAWKSRKVPQCALDDSSAICQLIADLLSDSILLFAPTRLFLILSDKNLRIRLILIFSTCIITSLVGLAHAIEIFRAGYPSRVYTAIIENNIALIVANIPVILTSVIDLKEAPWEEPRFLHELHNLDLETTISSFSPNEADHQPAMNSVNQVP